MKQSLTISFLVVSLLFSTHSLAQSGTTETGYGISDDSYRNQNQTFNTPVPVELFAGEEKVMMQLVIAKHFTPDSKFGFFNITSFVGSYKNKQRENEFLSQAFVTYDLIKRFSINLGGTINHYDGFKPIAAVNYMYANHNWLVIAMPNIELSQTHNAELFGLAEFKLPVTEKMQFYSKVQFIYNYDTKNRSHARSYLYLRAGIGFGDFKGGFAYNIDSYGSPAYRVYSPGLFFAVDLF